MSQLPKDLEFISRFYERNHIKEAPTYSLDIETLKLPYRLDVPMTIQIHNSLTHEPVKGFLLYNGIHIPYHQVPDTNRWLGLDRTPSSNDRTWMDVERSIRPELSARFPWDRTRLDWVPMNEEQRRLYERDLEEDDDMLTAELHISKVTNGWVVRAGCMTLVFDDPAKLATELTRYLHNPDEVYREYTKKYSMTDDAPDAGAAMGIAGDMAKEEVRYTGRSTMGEAEMLHTTAQERDRIHRR